MNLVLSASSGDRRGNTQSNRSAGEIVEFIRRFGFTGSVTVLLLTGVTNQVAAQSQQPRVETVSQAVLEAVQRNLNMFAGRYNISLADAQLVTSRMGRGGDSARRIECAWAEYDANLVALGGGRSDRLGRRIRRR
jgi:hypothetical protein